MPYQISTFGAVTLPIAMSIEDMSSASIPSTIQASMGASFDWRGSARQFPIQQQITVRGSYVGIGTGVAGELDLLTKINSLKGSIGKRDTLTRTNFANPGTTETRIARLLSVKINQDVEQSKALVAEVEATFETPTGGWRASSATTASRTGTGNISITMGGNIECQDAVITVSGGNITGLTVASSGIGVNWTWSGTATGGDPLTIDCGAKTIRRGTVNQYALTFSTSAPIHTARGWLPLAIGANTITVTPTGGTPANATTTITAFAVTA